MLKKLELNQDEQFKVFEKCKEKNIEFISSAFDEKSLEFLIKKIKVKKLKIASGEITNDPFILSHGKSGLEVMLSTGMSNYEEIEHALKILCYGYSKSSSHPNKKSLDKIYETQKSKNYLRKKVSILHCTSQYPASDKNLNLNAIRSIKDRFKIKVGYSDHSLGIVASCNAVSLGAQIIEKHFTLDKLSEGPDHSSSLEPDELLMLVENIRRTESSLGDGIKKATHDESKNLLIARKSIFAKKAIEVGDIFSEDNISIRRPGTGMPPSKFWELLGKASKKQYKIDEKI